MYYIWYFFSKPIYYESGKEKKDWHFWVFSIIYWIKRKTDQNGNGFSFIRYHLYILITFMVYDDETSLEEALGHNTSWLYTLNTIFFQIRLTT